MFTFDIMRIVADYAKHTFKQKPENCLDSFGVHC